MSADDFTVVDVETANSDLASICQIGIATFRAGALSGEWKSLVNPEDYFDPINISIHGIDEEQVANAPVWSLVFPEVQHLLSEDIVVSHTAFDRASLRKACAKYGLAEISGCWLDSACVSRRAWSDTARSGYGLASVAARLGIEYKAHDALEDARCAGEILLRAIAETGLSVAQWLVRVQQPIDPAAGGPIRRPGNPEGPLFGEVVVFTGSLSLPRHVAADLAAGGGCQVDPGVTKHTTLLVAGDQDVRKLSGHDKSAKQMKAEELIAKGQRIRILSESDFQQLVSPTGFDPRLQRKKPDPKPKPEFAMPPPAVKRATVTIGLGNVLAGEKLVKDVSVENYAEESALAAQAVQIAPLKAEVVSRWKGLSRFFGKEKK